MKLTNPLNFAGRLYMPGESVKGALPLDYAEQLQANGFLVESENKDDLVEHKEQITEQSIGILHDVTLEEFSKLSASEQKFILTQIGIDAGSNGKERTEQYQEWLEKKGDQDAKL